MNSNSAGERIRLRRKELKLTQQALSRVVGVSHVAISQWERGETDPSGENLLALAKALRCQPGYLVYGSTVDGSQDVISREIPEPIDLEDEELEREKQMLLDMFTSLPSTDRKKFLKEISDRKNEIDLIVEEVLARRAIKSKSKAS